jgi:anti-sigma B factor antagonist
MVYKIEERHPGALVIFVSGRISVESGDGVFAAAIDEALALRPRLLTVDLAEVTAVDSCGLGELAAAYSRARREGCRLRVVHANARVMEILRVTRLAAFLVEAPPRAVSGKALA